MSKTAKLLTKMAAMQEIKGDEIVKKIEKLVKIPSPTGFTGKVRDFLVENAEKNGISYRVTRKGAVVYSFGPQNVPGTFFAAHVDALGAIVTEIDDDEERVKIATVGGYPALYIIGEKCTIHTRKGAEYIATFLPENPAVHVNSKLREMVPDFENCSLRVDISLKDGEKLSDLISVGDFVSLDCGFRYIDGYVNSRHLDDKASAGIFLHLADIIKKNEDSLKSRISFFFNVTEETGQGIAATPQGDDLIVVDMGVVGGGTAGSEKCVSICAKDSSGPYNYDLTTELINIAEELKIPFKTDVFPFYGSDGSALLRSCSDTRVALIGQGVNASHGYERTHVNGLVATASLITAYIFR